PDRARHRRRLLEAACRRALVCLRFPDLHHRGRDPARDPPHRHHAPLRQLRRVERARELRAAGGPLDGVQPRQCAGARMNAAIARLGVVTLTLLVSLVLATTYWQVWAAPGLAQRKDNELRLVAEYTVKRGKILASDGKTVLAANRVKKIGGKTFYFR